jgi:hypothetical protein
MQRQKRPSNIFACNFRRVTRVTSVPFEAQPRNRESQQVPPLAINGTIALCEWRCNMMHMQGRSPSDLHSCDVGKSIRLA